ncbi:transposase [Novosphingobium sp.]|uniref:transposase n=1 Tax=Novosphingobium sp. TaxID=1874826 RepID=UPI002733A0BE|nr:transposase [Novosphingobium sp.]MDP3908469.1 transposase [Novosphingobium sp.]
MARLARIVIPGVAHHVTQRGNRRLPVFFGDDDRRAYLALIAEACAGQGTRCLAWCLKDNHVHLILVPASATACGRPLPKHIGATVGGSTFARDGAAICSRGALPAIRWTTPT